MTLANFLALGKQGFGMSGTVGIWTGRRDGPLPAQRFDTLLPRELDLCAELRVFEELMLAAEEKKETEI